MNEYDKTYFQKLIGYSNISGKDYRSHLAQGLRKRLISQGIKGKSLLDVGCGDGYYIKKFQVTFDIVGGDISLEGFKINPDISKDISIYQGDVCNMPFNSSSWDGIIALDVIEHLQDPLKGLQEILRVLKSSGILFLSTPNLNSLGQRTKRGNWFAYSDPTHISLHSESKWRDFLTESGFQIVQDGTDTLWDVPYPYRIPQKLQKYISSISAIIARRTVVFFPWSYGENYYAICRKTGEL